MEEWTRRSPKLALLLIIGALFASAAIASFAIFMFVASPNRSVAGQLFFGAFIPAIPFAVIGVVMAVAYRKARSSMVKENDSETERSNSLQEGSPARGYNGLAITGFSLAFGATFIGLFVSIAALVQIRRTGQAGRGLALAGVWISSIAIVLGTIALVVTGMQGLLPWQV